MPEYWKKSSRFLKNYTEWNCSLAYLVFQFFKFYALILFDLVDFFCWSQSKISASTAFLLELFLFLLLLAKVIYYWILPTGWVQLDVLIWSVFGQFHMWVFLYFKLKQKKVFCYQNCSDLLWENVFANSKPSSSNFKIFSQSLCRIIYLNSDRSEHCW